MSKFFKPQSGFTLVELLIAVTIVVILSAIGIAGFNSANRISAVQQQAGEIKSLARKLRTDASAAVKPLGTCSTNGAVFGTYMTLTRNGTSINYGTTCFDPLDVTPFSDYSTTNTLNLPSGQKVGSAFITKVTIFFSFDGHVYFYDFTGTSAGKVYPDRDEITDSATRNALILNDNGIHNLPVNVSDGSTYTNGNRYTINFNELGLICESRLNSGIHNTTCAQ